MLDPMKFKLIETKTISITKIFTSDANKELDVSIIDDKIQEIINEYKDYYIEIGNIKQSAFSNNNVRNTLVITVQILIYVNI
mgnify:CR=1 FL=1